MNYIHRLQLDVIERDESILTRQSRIEEFRSHLALPKFQTQADGSRGDWISTDDVRRWLLYIEDTGRETV